MENEVQPINGLALNGGGAGSTARVAFWKAWTRIERSNVTMVCDSPMDLFSPGEGDQLKERRRNHGTCHGRALGEVYSRQKLPASISTPCMILEQE